VDIKAANGPRERALPASTDTPSGSSSDDAPMISAPGWTRSGCGSRNRSVADKFFGVIT
jgi:hypothetical protein